MDVKERICPELGTAQLRKRPLANLELPLGDRLRRVGGDLEQERVRVAKHCLAAERREAVERLRGLRASLYDVAEADDLLDPEPFDVLECGAEGDVVPVLIREEPETHGQSPLLMPSSPLRTHSGWSVKSP
jgi:hypothetical protein